MRSVMAVSSTTPQAGHGRFRICRRGSVPSFVDMNAARTYEIRTYGCQMNFHDSERLAGLLEQSGYQRAPGDEVPDVVVFNTCAVRENADNRLYGNLGHLMPVKTAHPGMQIAVGGCLAQKDRAGIAERAPVGGRRVRHAQHRLAPGAARTGPGAGRGAGRDRGVAGAVPVGAARPPRIPVRRVGRHLRGLQQHLHLLHRAQPARPRGRPPSRRCPRRDRGAGQRGRARGHAAGAERQLLRSRLR